MPQVFDYPLDETPPPLDAPAGTGKIDDHVQIDEKRTGLTSLHLFNDAVQQLQHLHDQIARNKRASASKRLRDTSTSIFNLKKELRKPCTAQRKQELTEQITHLQHELSAELEAKDVASTLRIKNFYATNTGKMVPETFHCVKEPKKNRTIHSLQHEGRLITDTNEITEIMQKWYERTAERVLPQLETLDSFLARHNINLPQIDEDQCAMLEEEFTTEEIKTAISEANEVSAPGPSGQTITFLKLLFMAIPNIMTSALNQLVFVPGLLNDQDFHWIRHRKVVYIPKLPQPASPGDYRPLSMLEVLYKIPSWILSARLSRILPTVIGPHQHGFMTR
jgi:hypothetical protein